MKFLLTGGTGFIGKHLADKLNSSGHMLTIVTRSKKENTNKTNYISWEEQEKLKEAINQADIVINLAGESVAKKRWSKEQKDLLRQSRIVTTQLIVNAINSSPNKPKKLINASAVGIYGNRMEEKIVENSSTGDDFLANICKEWEGEALKAKTNVVILRIGIVLGAGGGALEKMLPPFKMFIGGPLGTGGQFMPWISLEDVIGLILFAAQNDKVVGVINATSPNPVTNKEFSKTLGNVLHRPSCMLAPAFALRILLGEMSDLLLGGQKVYPKKAIEFGYKFKYPELEGALRKMLKTE